MESCIFGERLGQINKCALPRENAHCVISFSIWFVLQHAAGTDVAAAVVGLGVLALGNTAAASRVDEMESVVLVHLGDDAHVTYAATARTALEEHEVARLQILLLDADAVKNLTPRRTVELDTKALEHVARESRAVKGAGRHCTITIGRTAETVSVIDDLVNDVVAAVLFKLFKNGALLARFQTLRLGR